MRRKAKRREPVDDLIDEIIRMRRKAKRKVGKAKRKAGKTVRKAGTTARKTAKRQAVRSSARAPKST
jgi:hypothetical protein